MAAIAKDAPEEGGEGRPSGFDGYGKAYQDKLLRVLYSEPEFACTVGVHLDAAQFDGKVRRWVAGVLVSHAKKHGVGASMDALKIRLARDLKTRRLQDADAPEVEAAIARLKKGVRDRSFVKEETFRFVKNQLVRDVIMKSLDHMEKLDFDSVDREFSRVLEVNAAALGGYGQFYASDVDARVARRAQSEKNGIPTGFKLDEYLRPGGLWPTAIGIFVGEKGRGKSHSLVSVSAAAILEAQEPVLFVSLELDEDGISERFDARFADISLSDISEEGEEVKRVVSDMGSRWGEFLVVKRFPRVTLTVPMLRAYKRQLEAKKFYPKLVVIDYADEMLPTVTRAEGAEWEGQSNIYSELSKFAVEERIALWTAAQMNRGGFGRESADNRHLGGSIRKVQIADLVLYLLQTPQEKKAKIGRIRVENNRKGPDGFEIPVRMDWSRSLLSDRGS